jgi:uncharacterized protein
MDDQSETVAFLADGASYGLPGAPVEQVVTHCSHLFLVGDRAYKLKRAVQFTYLDYSTPMLRERFCRAELTLNRRTAPNLYVGVHRVTRRATGGLALDGQGEAVDFLLEMRRFREEDLFDRMAEGQRLTPALMRELADEIALFHRDAEITPGFGGAAALERTLAINHDNLVLAAPPLDLATIDRLRRTSTAQLADIAALLDARQRAGKVRRCHGDLHLRNICLHEGKPTLFDCIEFSDDFACIDVLYDLAFLLMDLTQRGLDAHASLVFNRYLDRSGESDGLLALPLFLSTRAAVRAHVAGTLVRAGPPPQAAEAAASARAYLALALKLLEPYPPCLVAVGGLSGSGKSTVAQALAVAFPPAPGARLLRSDVMRKRLAGVAPETALPRESYSQGSAQRVYAALYEEAAATLGVGYSVVVDATFLRQEERQAIAAVANEAGVPFIGLWLEAPREVLARRIAGRYGDASDADLTVLNWQLGRDPGTVVWQRVDAAGSLAETIAAARAFSATAAPAPSSS